MLLIYWFELDAWQGNLPFSVSFAEHKWNWHDYTQVKPYLICPYLLLLQTMRLVFDSRRSHSQVRFCANRHLRSDETTMLSMTLACIGVVQGNTDSSYLLVPCTQCHTMRFQPNMCMMSRYRRDCVWKTGWWELIFYSSTLQLITHFSCIRAKTIAQLFDSCFVGITSWLCW